MGSKRNRCVRCETLERKQQGKEVYQFQGVYICSVCLEEMQDELLFPKDVEEDESGSEEFDQ